VLAGWSSNSKYSLLGSLRGSAQMISYELAIGLALVGVLLMSGSLSLRSIVESQSGTYWGFVPRWNVFPQFVAFLCYLIAAIAETNRLPFDLPEAETELVAGYHTEYSSMKFAMFFLAEYAHLFTASFLVTLLFLGGWLSPFPAGDAWTWTIYLPVFAVATLGLLVSFVALRLRRPLHRILLGAFALALLALAAVLTLQPLLIIIQGPFWFLAKSFLLLFIFVWIRSTLPRFRYDQLMNFGWKFLVPVAVLNIVVTSLLIAQWPTVSRFWLGG